MLAVLIAVGAVAALAFFLLRRPAGGPIERPPAPVYDDMVSAFYTGTVALIVQDPQRPEPNLKRATQLVPEEPAAWANLGLLYVRGRTRLQEAEQALSRAQSLAPNSSEIAALLAHMEVQKGRLPEAIAHFRRAVELDPKNVHARYELAQLIDRQREADSDRQFQEQMEGILAARPDNIEALVQLARVAARRNDAQALSRAVDGITAQSAAWPADLRQAVTSLAAVKDRPAEAQSRILLVANLLRAESSFRRSVAALRPPDNAVGIPLERFLRLPNPTPHPAEADTALTFGEKSAGTGRFARYAVLTPELPKEIAEKHNARPLRQTRGSILSRDAGDLRISSNGAEQTVAFPAGSAAQTSPAGVAVADLNYDFRQDLVLAGAGGIRILLQREDGGMEDHTAGTRLPPNLVSAAAYGVWPADVDLDGDLDIVVGAQNGPTQILRNNGDGTFTPRRSFESVRGLRDFVWADLDEDGDPDAAMLDLNGRLTLLMNERSGQFQSRPAPEAAAAVRAIAAADIDQDGRVDLLAVTAPGAIVQISSEDDDRGWKTVEIARWESAPAGSLRLMTADLDNNGGPDLVAASPASSQIWLHDTNGQFRPLGGFEGVEICSVEEMNGDGLPDLLTTDRRGRISIRQNNSRKGYRWVDIRPRATKVARGEGGAGDNRISTFGIGGEVEVRSALLTQKQIIAGPTVHFGLGQNQKADYARFVWPNGSVQGEFEVEPGRQVIAEQRLKGSCPWLFAWNGQKMEFVTDFIWRSPLGLRINAQDTAGVMTTEDWVKLRGDQLAPRNGRYDLRITAELWETHYFDHISLIVVDHPQDTEVFVDERFAFPPPKMEVHAVSPPRPFARVRDDHGSDVSDIVRDRDGWHLDTFGRGRYQGITRDHYVEVELPEQALRAGRVCLVGYGWIHPTDSSINVAIAQGSHPAPQGLSIEAPDGSGGWKTAQSGLGFPAGKTKTVLLDLTDVLQKSGFPNRLRLRTNLEIYWDSLGWARWQPEAPLKVERLPLAAAELQYRGFSAVRQKDRSSPEIPDYDTIWTRAQMWRDLIGFYTRFGDVKELLEKVDDRYVIMNAGDEMILQFDALPPAAEGWKRDYALIGDGWEKDGDYNTAFSKTVLPLPSHDNPQYATPPGRLEDDPVYRRYPRDWQNYHTRYVAPDGFRAALRPRTGN